ncbi:MAG: DUF2510 domain-containing protein [Marmoricola sp.]
MCKSAHWIKPLPDERWRRTVASVRGRGYGLGMQPCPYCAEEIPERVDHCPFCKRTLPTVGPGPAAVPGWYHDPRMANTWRYWDGSSWTEHRTPVDVTSPGGSTHAGAAPQVLSSPLPGVRGNRAGWYAAPDGEHLGQERYWDGFQWLPSWRPASERAVGRATSYVKVMNWLLLGAVAVVVLGYLLSRIGS